MIPKVLGKNILIKKLEVKQQPVNGLYLPDSQFKQVQGEVIFIGKEVDDISIGDIVLLNDHFLTEINVNDMKCHRVNIDQVLAILPKE